MKHTRSRRRQTQKQRQGQRRRKTMRGGGNTPATPQKSTPGNPHTNMTTPASHSNRSPGK